MNRLREAEATASNACKQLNQSAQALTVISTILLKFHLYVFFILQLHASVLMKDPITSSKVIKRLLAKAIATDLTHTPAVVLLAEQYEQEQQYEEASQLLLRHVAVRPTSVVHQMIGDNFARMQKDDDAFNHYCIALRYKKFLDKRTFLMHPFYRLDPNNQRATEGLNNIGRSMSMCLNKRDSYYVSTGESSSYVSQGLSASDHDPDPESDTEQWPTIDFS